MNDCLVIRLQLLWGMCLICDSVLCPFQLPDMAALATAEANGFMGMQHALQFGQLPPEFASASTLGVNVPSAVDPSQRPAQEQLAQQMDGHASHPGRCGCVNRQNSCTAGTCAFSAPSSATPRCLVDTLSWP